MLSLVSKTMAWGRLNFIPGSVNNELLKVAARGVRHTSAKSSFITSAFSLDNLDPRMPIWRLAQKVLGREVVTDADIAHLFFTPDAAEYLKLCPNSFWFWKLLLATALEDNSPRKTRKQVVYAVNTYLKDVPNRLRSLPLESISDWSTEDLAAALASGLVLVERKVERDGPLAQTKNKVISFNLIANNLFQQK